MRGFTVCHDPSRRCAEISGPEALGAPVTNDFNPRQMESSPVLSATTGNDIVTGQPSTEPSMVSTMDLAQPLLYGQVVQDVRPSEGDVVYRVSVLVEPPAEQRTFLSSEIFSFKSSLVDATGNTETGSSIPGMHCLLNDRALSNPNPTNWVRWPCYMLFSLP